MLEEGTENLRYAQRLKDSHVYQHIQGLAKKIRKNKKFEEVQIDADVQKRQIDVFYKVGWQYQHHHSSMACDISDPIYASSLSSNNQCMQEFYDTMNRFIYRLKKEHEDQSAFRVELFHYMNIKQAKQQQGQNLINAKIIYKSILGVIQMILQKLLENFRAYEEQEIEESYWEVQRIFILLEDWVKKFQDQVHYHPQIQNQDLQYVSNSVFGSMLEFITNFITITDKVVNEKRSALINYQPYMSHLTYLVHPVLFGIYAFYRREKILWQNQYEHDISKIEFDDKGPQEKGRLLEDIKHLEISKVVFINLDGYESEFNIQLAKNMDKHLLYICFPKFDNDGSEEHMSQNNRFFKKIFYKYTQEMYEFDNQEYDVFQNDQNQYDEDYLSQQDQKDIKYQFQMRYNPEHYFKTVSEISQNKMQNNKNIYTLPISFKYMQQEFSTLFKDQKDVSKYASYFVWFLIRDFVGDDIKKFNPNYIVFSYSGKINIIDDHFIRIMQEFAEASNRKVIFYPNFTTALCNCQEEYDNKANIRFNFEETDLNLMRKFSQFLKISSGTYNLQASLDRQPILTKFKVAKVNNYIIGLLKCLSEHEYDHLKNRISEIILKSPDIIISNGIKQCKEDIQNSVPLYYRELYEKIHILLSQPGQKLQKNIEDLTLQIRQNLRQISDTNMQQNILYLIREIITNYYLQTSSQKLSQFAYIYIKNHDEKQQFDKIKHKSQTIQENQPTKFSQSTGDYINGFYCLTLKYNNGKQRKTLPIYQNTEIIYKTDQRFKRKINGKKYCNIMIMNHIDEQMLPISYAGTFQVSDKATDFVNNQRIQVLPLVINSRNLNKQFVLKKNWNYAETSRFYILYWPTQYNLLQAKLHNIQETKYQPRILNQIYVAQIPNKRLDKLVFNLAQFDETQSFPRKHCSSYQMPEDDKLFIFGGFFDQQNNYLNLQTNITGFDFQFYDEQNRKCVVTNQKGAMYDLEPLKAQNNQIQTENNRTNLNSYVRTRRGYEFYKLSELCQLTQQQKRQQQQMETVFMIGGYGQNFLRPYSLMSCNYYELKFDKRRRQIKSIERRFVYNRVITSNLKGFIKNKGSFDEFPVLENNVIMKKYLSPQHYVAHRSVYKINQGAEQSRNRYQLDIKVKYFFGIPLFTNYRKSFNNFATKIGQNYQHKYNESKQLLLSQSPLGNHYILVFRGKDNIQMLRVQMEVQEDKNSAPLIYGLPHDSIVSIDVKSKNVFALVMHKQYTKNNYMLAECQIYDENSLQVVLKPIHNLPNDLSQYSLFSPRKGQVLLLHGLSFEQICIKDYYIHFSRKDRQKTVLKQSKIQCLPKISSKQYNKIQSFFIKNFLPSGLQIKVYNFLMNRKSHSQPITFIINRLKRNSHTNNFQWNIQEKGSIYFEDEATKQMVKIDNICQIKHFSPQFHSAFFSNNDKSKQLVLIKIVSKKKNEYYGELSSAITIEEQRKLFKILVSKSKPNQTWNRSLRVNSNTKTMNRYQNYSDSQ